MKYKFDELKESIVKDEMLQRIARYLMLHSSFSINIGLLNGKTGIAIFFYHYGRYTHKKIYNEYADELLNELYKELNKDNTINFEDGLCGIAWGIEYLIQNQFVKGDPDAVLVDLDKRIMEWDVRHISDCSLEKGLSGIACYLISRMENRKRKYSTIPQDYTLDLLEAMKGKKEKIDPALMGAIENLLAPCEDESEDISNRPVKFYNPVFKIVEKIKFDTKKVFETTRTLGIIQAGYAGIGLKLMGIYKL